MADSNDRRRHPSPSRSSSATGDGDSNYASPHQLLPLPLPTLPTTAMATGLSFAFDSTLTMGELMAVMARSIVGGRMTESTSLTMCTAAANTTGLSFAFDSTLTMGELMAAMARSIVGGRMTESTSLTMCAAAANTTGLSFAFDSTLTMGELMAAMARSIVGGRMTESTSLTMCAAAANTTGLSFAFDSTLTMGELMAAMARSIVGGRMTESTSLTMCAAAANTTGLSFAFDSTLTMGELMAAMARSIVGGRMTESTNLTMCAAAANTTGLSFAFDSTLTMGELMAAMARSIVGGRMTESTSLTMCAAAANTTGSSLGAASSRNSNVMMDLPEDVVHEILARLPADPKLLMRLSLVSKEWKRIFSDPVFIRRYCKLNRPPLLGFFVNDYSAGDVGDAAIFVPATTYFRPAREVFPPHAIVIDGRHGMLLLYDIEGDNLLVWNPITNAQFIRIPIPINPKGRHWTSSVLCCIPHCDHKQCQGESFHVVLISSARDRDCTTAAFYLSDDSAWEEQHIHVHERLDLDLKISVVIGEHVYIPTIDSCSILEVDVRSKKMKIIVSPPPPLHMYKWSSTMLMTTEGGDHLRFTWVNNYKMYFWDWEGGSTTWSPQGCTEIENIPPINTASAHPIGFLQGAILIEVAGHIFMVNISTQETEEIYRGHGLSPEFRMTVPYHAYFAPGN